MRERERNSVVLADGKMKLDGMKVTTYVLWIECIPCPAFSLYAEA